MEKMVLEALEFFSSTRHIVLYYEDLVKNRTVSCFSSSLANLFYFSRLQIIKRVCSFICCCYSFSKLVEQLLNCDNVKSQCFYYFLWLIALEITILHKVAN